MPGLPGGASALAPGDPGGCCCCCDVSAGAARDWAGDVAETAEAGDDGPLLRNAAAAAPNADDTPVPLPRRCSCCGAEGDCGARRPPWITGGVSRSLQGSKEGACTLHS